MSTAPTPFGAPLEDERGVYPALAGCAPATIGRRVACRMLDVLMSFAVVGILALVTSRGRGEAPGIISGVVLSGVGVGYWVYFCRTGFLPAGRLIGIRQVRVYDGGAPGWNGLGKYLLLQLVSAATCGIAPIVIYLLIKPPLRRAWHDRVSGLIVLDIKAGRDPLGHPVSAPGGTVPVLRDSSAGPGPVSLTQQISAPGADSGIVSVGESIGSPPPALTHANEFTQVRTPAPVPPVIAVGGDDELIIDVPWRTGSSAPAAPSPPVTAPLGRSSPVPAASPSEAPVGPAATVSGQAVLIGQAGDVEEHTVLAPGLFMPETATLASGERGVELAGDAGDRIAVDGALLLGRNPAHLSGFETARLVALVDATMSVSKTHAALGPDPDGLWLEDLHSTNGTFVTTPGGVRQAVLPGGRVTVQAGSTVHLGKRSFVVGLR